MQKYRDDLIEVGSIVCHAKMLCEGLYPGTCQMDDKQFAEASAGALRMLGVALDKANELLTNIPLDMIKGK